MGVQASERTSVTKETLRTLKGLGRWFEFRVFSRSGRTYLMSRYQWYCWDGEEWVKPRIKDLPKDLFEMEKRRMGL
jgi:hypothetical protein